MRPTVRNSLLVTLLAAVLGGAATAQTAYHDQTLGFHLARYISLKSAGYRLLSVDVAGDLSSQRWAAVWEHAAGPDWIGGFGMSRTDYVLWRRDRLAEGYRDDWITSAGAGSSGVYGAVMVRDGRVAISSYDASTSLLESEVAIFERRGYMLNSISVHGTASDPRYAFVFVEDPTETRWGYSKNDTVSSYQTQFDAFVQTCRARPAIVTASSSQRYVSVFRDDSIGQWVARHDMTKAAYDAEAARLAGSGYEPYQIMVAGRGSAARYAALFRRGFSPPGVLVRTGVEVPVFAAIDTLMSGPNGFMQRYNARAAGVAITKNGRLVFARAYSWGPPGTPVVQPTDGFRLASLSKSIAAIAVVHRTQRTRTLTMNKRLVDLVALGSPADPRVNLITVQHLIDHRSGYNRGWPTTVTDKLQFARQTIQNEMLATNPGATEEYSNGAYQLLSVALEQNSGVPFWSYVTSNVMAPLGITRAHLITSAPVAGDAFCPEARWGVSRQLAVESNFAQPGSPLTNSAYAVRWPSMDASGGIVMSPVDYVRLMSGIFDPTVDTSVLHPVARMNLQQMIEAPGRTGGWDSARDRTVDGRVIKVYEKGGLWRSAHTYGLYRTDGVAIAAFCTGPHAPDRNAIQDVIDQVETAGTWPTNDLFPSYGLPSYPRVNPGSVTSFGRGCGPAGAELRHTSSGLPEIGARQTFELSRGTAGAHAFLYVGLSNRYLGNTRLPIELGFIGAPGCWIHIDPIVAFSTRADRTGRARLTLQHPEDPALLGARFYTQYVMNAPGANALGLLYSNALATVLGS